MSERPQSFRWLFAELLVVALGIVLGFQAESFRDRRADRRQEAAALRAIAADLREDSTSLAAAYETVQRQDRAVRRLADHFSGKKPLPVDSITQVFLRASFGPTWRSSAPTYRGLRDSARLGLLRDDRTRGLLVEYYDDWSPYLEQMLGYLSEWRDEFLRSAAVDFVAVPAGPNTEDTFLYELATPAERIPTHPEFRGSLGLVGRWTWWVALRFEGGIERNAEVMAAVDARIAEFE